MSKDSVQQIRTALQRFQDGYTHRQMDRIDEFLQLFVQEGEPELIGIGAFERGGAEWFEGLEKIREIILSDWEYWGNVAVDVGGAKITVNGNTAWLTTTGTIEQTNTFDAAMPFYLEQMASFLSDESKDSDTKLMEATHYGMRRLRERAKGMGHKWPFVFSAVLVKEVEWRFHTIHWSMPVD